MAESMSSRPGQASMRPVLLLTLVTGCVLLLAGNFPVNGGKKPAPAQVGFPVELAWVPPEAGCFIHARFGDIKAGKYSVLLNALLLEFGRPIGDILHNQTDI